ncbi:MAG TPA: four helix bundle protein [Cytophagales bacterium]|jgi:four helix bundle protein|nr:four helix bundle protein [Cytophagales bacterium]
MKSFEEIKSWQEARNFCNELFLLLKNKKSFNSDYGLKDQMLRSSGSIMDNIAEGFGRGGNKEFVQYLFIARASCYETKSQLYRAFDRGYLNKEEKESFINRIELIAKLISGLIKYLQGSKSTGYKDMY